MLSHFTIQPSFIVAVAKQLPSRTKLSFAQPSANCQAERSSSTIPPIMQFARLSFTQPQSAKLTARSAIIAETSFDLDISPATAKRYLLKHSARKAEFLVQEKLVRLRNKMIK
jgi:hypothetical protein